MSVRRMLPDELEAAVSVWRAANVARGAPHGAERTARIRAKLSASDVLPFVALRPEIVGMALAEPGRLDDGAGELDQTRQDRACAYPHANPIRMPSQRQGSAVAESPSALTSY